MRLLRVAESPRDRAINVHLKVRGGEANNTISPPVTLWNPVYLGEPYWPGKNCAVQRIAVAVGLPEEGVTIIEI